MLAARLVELVAAAGPAAAVPAPGEIGAALPTELLALEHDAAGDGQAMTAAVAAHIVTVRGAVAALQAWHDLLLPSPPAAAAGDAGAPPPALLRLWRRVLLADDGCPPAGRAAVAALAAHWLGVPAAAVLPAS